MSQKEKIPKHLADLILNLHNEGLKDLIIKFFINKIKNEVFVFR